MITNERAWKLLRIALPIAALIVIFFSGLFPVENLLSFVPHKQLTASVSSAEVIALTNQNRIDDHLPALMTNPLLTQAAQLKAEDMAANSYYAHISPDGKSPLYWLGLVGYHYLNAGENLVIDRATSEEVVSAWMNSADHRENILRPQFTEIGVGIATGVYEGQSTTYVVQEFGTPYPNPPVIRKAEVTVPAPVPTPVPVAIQTLQETTPITTFKPEPIPLPTIPTIAKPKVAATPKSTNTLVNNVAALAAPVSETIQVHLIATTSTTTPEASTTPAASSTPTFTLPMHSDTVVALPQEQGTSTIPQDQFQTVVGKERIAFLRSQILTLWHNFKTFIL
ncbi:MAG: CAP domain-containing protein [Candidatus Paceibacterota bacterium]